MNNIQNNQLLFNSKTINKKVNGDKINLDSNKINQSFNQSFNKVLNNQVLNSTNEDNSPICATSKISFSKHALDRLNSREINFTKSQVSRLENAVETAKDKGINESLIIVDDVKLVVNVKSKTVVTAMKNNDANVFTNIDGAVIV